MENCSFPWEIIIYFERCENFGKYINNPIKQILLNQAVEKSAHFLKQIHFVARNYHV